MPVRVRVTHHLHPNVQVQLRQSRGLSRQLYATGIRVQTAARRRLASSPKRIDTGRLRASIGVAEVQRNGGVAIAVGTNVEYAIYVHEGTRYMAPNPFLADGLRQVLGR